MGIFDFIIGIFKKNGTYPTYIGGELFEKTTYRNGIKNGLCQRFYSGFLYEEFIYKNDVRDGWAKQYYVDSKSLFSEGNYIKDNREGIWKEYYENGKLKFEKSWKDDQEVFRKKYFENGHLAEEFFLRNKLKNGLCKTYHSKNGKLKSEGNFKKGRLVGLLKRYNENGQLEIEKKIPKETSVKETSVNETIKILDSTFLQSAGPFCIYRLEWWKAKIGLNDDIDFLNELLILSHYFMREEGKFSELKKRYIKKPLGFGKKLLSIAEKCSSRIDSKTKMKYYLKKEKRGKLFEVDILNHYTNREDVLVVHNILFQIENIIKNEIKLLNDGFIEDELKDCDHFKNRKDLTIKQCIELFGYYEAFIGLIKKSLPEAQMAALKKKKSN